jgi:hypothetical protein
VSEDCYIYWDGEDVPEENRYIYMQCTECHINNKKGTKWAAQYGYGDYSIACHNCQKLIHQATK